MHQGIWGFVNLCTHCSLQKNNFLYNKLWMYTYFIRIGSIWAIVWTWTILQPIWLGNSDLYLPPPNISTRSSFHPVDNTSDRHSKIQIVTTVASIMTSSRWSVSLLHWQLCIVFQPLDLCVNDSSNKLFVDEHETRIIKKSKYSNWQVELCASKMSPLYVSHRILFKYIQVNTMYINKLQFYIKCLRIVAVFLIRW